MAGVICVGPKPTAASPLVSKTIAITSTQKGRQEQEHAAQNMAVGVRLAQRVEQQQSMALVQIMLHASVSPLWSQRSISSAIDAISVRLGLCSILGMKEDIMLRLFG